MMQSGPRYRWLTLALAAGAMLTGGEALADEKPPQNPIEVGTVEWRRDFEAALGDSERTGKPVFAFFQEVPGCSGCKSFGSVVMSDPAIVQAVEDEFIPVLIYNNRGGKDAQLLERYGEPAWNYQVIRFLDGTGTDLIPRKDRIWTIERLATRMIRSLEVVGRRAPGYLEVVAYENETERHATAAFAQHCFWVGEFELGQIPGVITTEAGWIEGREVVLLHYHRDLLSLEALLERAAQTKSADKVFLPTDAERDRARGHGSMPVGELSGSYKRAEASDQKRQIGKSAFSRLDLSPMQLTKVNAFAPLAVEQALDWLTMRQREEFARLTAKR